MNVFVMRLLSICFLANLLIALPAGAQLVQVPNLSGFGNSANVFPFFTAPMRYQQIYASSAFPHGGTIDKIMFRDDDVFGHQYEVELDLQVAFAYAATTVDTATSIFARNIGENFTIVLDGKRTESHDGSLSTTFGFVLDVADTFTYDPSRGDLLMQILMRETNVYAALDASWSPQQNVTTRIRAEGINRGSGHIGPGFDGLSNPYGLVTQFQFVPEPSTVAQFGAMLLLMIARRRRHE